MRQVLLNEITFTGRKKVVSRDLPENVLANEKLGLVYAFLQGVRARPSYL